jgi:hypothetical protein
LSAALVAGCASRPDYTPNATVAIKVLGNNQRTVASAQVGNEIKVELPPPDPSGYVWEISALDTRYLKQRTEVLPLAGAAGPWSVSFFALHDGRTRIRFVLVPPTKETEKPTADLEEVVITIE